MSDIIATVLRASVHRFIGRLGGDPEIKYLESGKIVANARIAINRPGSKRDDGQEPDWFKVEIWGEQAQAMADSPDCKKGQLIDVVGRVRSNPWTTRDGEQRTDLIIMAEMWRPVKPAAVPATAPAPAPAPATAPAAASSDDPPF